MLSSRQEEMQTFQDTISAQFRETKEGVERECRVCVCLVLDFPSHYLHLLRTVLFLFSRVCMSFISCCGDSLQRVSEQFAPLLSKFQVLEETIQKEKAAREAQADEISRLTELIRALQVDWLISQYVH